MTNFIKSQYEFGVHLRKDVAAKQFRIELLTKAEDDDTLYAAVQFAATITEALEIMKANSASYIKVTDRHGKIVMSRDTKELMLPPTSSTERHQLETEMVRILESMDHDRQADNHDTLRWKWERVEYLEAMINHSRVTLSQAFRNEVQAA